MDREDLYERIDSRVLKMIEMGYIGEVQSLLNQGVLDNQADDVLRLSASLSTSLINSHWMRLSGERKGHAPLVENNGTG